MLVSQMMKPLCEGGIKPLIVASLRLSFCAAEIYGQRAPWYVVSQES
jgi:hypothetical protein